MCTSTRTLPLLALAAGGLLGSAAISPRAASAQQSGKTYRIGLVMGTGSPVYPLARAALVEEMKKSGFIEGQNLVVDARSNQVDSARLLAIMAELVAARADLIISGGSEQTLRAAVSAAPATPIVMWANNFDPFARGYVQSLVKPGGNVTGVHMLAAELDRVEWRPHGRRVEIVPAAAGEYAGAVGAAYHALRLDDDAESR